ncbi:MAG: NTP transferase domain-containing protein [Verrucomicrobia bacterium]|nr:NTP transferase domain-containing protein [Verrucomicrobiota bacterium]
MSSKSLLVLAAGIGSRYGGLKQMDPIGPAGEFILDYSVYDAKRAGFDNVVFVIRDDIEADFRRIIGARIAPHIAVDYVCQRLGDVPEGVTVPADRKKPWGTGHATLTGASAIHEPFGVINADDFYGAESYRRLGAFLDETADDPARYAMVGYILHNTISPHGHVARGLCTTNADGYLTSVEELTNIVQTDQGIVCDDRKLSGKELVSMNLWGFKPAFFAHLHSEFAAFLKDHGDNPRAEYFVPTVVNTLIDRGAASCTVLQTPDKWAGVTYPQEKADVEATIRALIDQGVYPESLWG